MFTFNPSGWIKAEIRQTVQEVVVIVTDNYESTRNTIKEYRWEEPRTKGGAAEIEVWDGDRTGAMTMVF